MGAAQTDPGAGNFPRPHSVPVQFPYGKALFSILVVALASGGGVWWTHSHYRENRPDLVLVTHARLHADVYRAKLPEFERMHGVRVSVQEFDEVALRSRLLAAFAAGSEVPDVVELAQNPAVFLHGPVGEIGFLDLTSWVRERGLDEQMVASRFSIWQRKGVTFGVPHDVHPVMLAYRADIVEGELGIDVSAIETWDDFVAMGQRIVRDLNGDGQTDRFALEMPVDGGDALTLLMLQRGVGYFDAAGRVTFDEEGAAQTIEWYIRELHGARAIGYGPGFGQPLWQGMLDGLILFYFTPDWRTRQMEQYAPGLAGKMKLMPLPAWEKGGRRTSTWGATGIAITKRSARPELAKQLVEFLYVDQTNGGRSWADMRILPPTRAAWSLPVFDAPSPFFSGQPVMRLYAGLAGDVPPNYTSPFTLKAMGKRNEAFVRCAEYFQRHGEAGFPAFVRTTLKQYADSLREIIARARITEQ
jgi:arabinosaccharide transport system substrate-binding protein